MCSRVFMVQQKIDTLYTVYLIYTQKYVASKVILKCSLIISVLFAVYFKQKKKNSKQQAKHYRLCCVDALFLQWSGVPGKTL
jgi:hypothetical protein